MLGGLYKNSLGDAKGALLDLNQAIDINPVSGESYFIRGITKSSIGDQKGGINDCNSALKLTPTHAEAYYLRGILRYDGGDEPAGCLDLSRSGELGYSQAYPLISLKCNRNTALRR